MDKVGNVTIRKRNNGKYEYRFEIEPLDGKRRWKTKGGYARKKEAQEDGYKARQEYIETGGRPERKQENISVQVLSEIWLDKIVLTRLEPTTYASYEAMTRVHIIPAIGKMPVKDVDTLDIEELLQDMADNGSSKSTMESTKAAASGMFGYAKDKLKLIKINPVKGADMPKPKKKAKERVPYTLEQMNLLLKETPEGNKYRLPLILGIHCGLRISEAVGLTWDCVDFKRNMITIDKQLKIVSFKHKTYRALKSLKTEKSYRTIKINDVARQELLKEKQQQIQNKEMYGAYYIHNKLETLELKAGKELDYIVTTDTPEPGSRTVEFVCRRQDGKYIDVVGLGSFLRRRAEKLGFGIDTHTGRHTHATLAVEQGAKIPAVAARLGQSNLSTTMKYVHNTDKMENEALEAFDAALSTGK